MKAPLRAPAVMLVSLVWMHSARAAPVTEQTHIEAPLALVLEVLEVPCHVQQWMPGLVEIRLLEQPAPGTSLVYLRHDAPWPWLPRDAVMRFERHDGNPTQILMWAQPDHLPPREGHIRIPEARSSWSLSPEKATTLVTFRQQVSPGGATPQWLADRIAQPRARQTLDALRTYAQALYNLRQAGQEEHAGTAPGPAVSIADCAAANGAGPNR